MPWVLLAVLFSLIATVLLLPRIPAVRRIAGVDSKSLRPEGEGYVLVPSQFGWPEEEAPPSRILTANYRDRWIRPIAMTSDTAMLGLPSSFRSVSVIHWQDEEVEKALKEYEPRQVKLYFPKRQEEEKNEGDESPEVEACGTDESPDPTGVVAASRSMPIPTNSGNLAEVARHGVAVGDECLALTYGIRDHDLTGSLNDTPALARG